ncbi:MAG: TIGR02391 family protein [Actinomycetota bacterium]|nr:TIGR02391 family protein [Actinomycetota bacterium]
MVVSDEVAAALRDLRLLDAECERLVFRARAADDGVVLTTDDEELDELIGFVAAEANHEPDRRRQTQPPLSTALDHQGMQHRSAQSGQTGDMRWDDLWLLKLIDDMEAEGQTGHLQNGLQLLQQAAAVIQHQIDWDRDPWPFARELLLACEASYLTWQDQTSRHVGGNDPQANTQYWLQQIWELRLTLAGRDRARGRVIQVPLPDPAEDDGRPITGATLEEIAKAIGDTYSTSQLRRYLFDSGIPAKWLPELPETQGKVDYVFRVFDALHDGGSATRRTLREFIGGWLDGRHHVGPRGEVRKRLVAILGQQGWHIKDGRLVIGERTYDSTGALTPLGLDVRLAALHVDVRAVAERYVASGNIEVGIFESFKAINNRVKEITGLDLDGTSLINRAFADSNPVMVLADLSTQTGKNIQSGFRFLFAGAVQGLRNPDAHEQFRPLDHEEGFEALAFASMLMRRLETAQVLVKNSSASDASQHE